jgi:hypothetical protein
VRIRKVIEYYDSQTEDEEAAEIERALIADAGRFAGARHPPQIHALTTLFRS